MAELNKTIKGMEYCKYAIGEKQCSECPYERVGNVNCFFSLASDVLELLKEKEPKKGKDEILKAIIGLQGYTDVDEFKRTRSELTVPMEYFDGIYDSIRAVENLFEQDGDGE